MKLLKRHPLHAGFTMVELIIACTVLAILMVALMTYFNPVTQLRKARDTRRRSELADYRTGLEAYSVMHGGLYPDTGGNEQAAAVFLNTNERLANFMSTFPTDPVGSDSYAYYYLSAYGGQIGAVYARLEYDSDALWVSCTNGKTGERRIGEDAYCTNLDSPAGREDCTASFCE